MKHTKGEWTWKQNRGNNYYEHSVFVKNNYDGTVIAELSGDGCTKEEAKANARLIAAAPALLAACKCLQADLEGARQEMAGYPECWDLSISEGIAAINKTKQT